MTGRLFRTEMPRHGVVGVLAQLINRFDREKSTVERTDPKLFLVCFLVFFTVVNIIKAMQGH
ncbi:hypothetical protein MCAMS1_00679 [biofilm metagenome]